MAQYKETVHTEKAFNLVAKLLAGKVDEITITKVVTSEKDYSNLSSEEMKQLTILENIRQESLVSDKKANDDGSVTLHTIFYNSELEKSYYLKTIGVYAQDPDEGEILFSVTPALEADYIPTPNGTNITTIILDIQTILGESQVNLKGNPSALVDVAMLSEKLDKGGYNGTAQELFNLIKNYCPYQIGDIYQTTNKVNPSEIWQGTEWQRIEGRVLKGTSGERNSKETEGSNTVKLTVDNMPSHNHSATNSAHTHSSGNHNHYIFSSSTGGSHITDSNRKEYAPNYRAVLRNTTDRDDYVIAGSGGTANAGRTSSSNITIGSATTTTTIGSTGKGTEFSVENEYYTVHMWLRTK